MRRRSILATLLLGGAVLGACGGGDGGGPSPTPGTLTATLATAATGPGAILFTISGGEITSVSAGGYTTYETALGSASRRVLLTGNIAVGTLVSFQVPDIAAAGSYVASVQQVSARSTAAIPYKQETTSGYTITIQ